MSSSLKLVGFLVIASVLAVHVQGRPQEQPTVETVTEKTTWDKIKDGVEKGWNVAYDEVHCGFHKVKELVKHHEHDEGNDPCTNKPYQQSTSPKSIDLRITDDIPVTTTSKPL